MYFATMCGRERVARLGNLNSKIRGSGEKPGIQTPDVASKLLRDAVYYLISQAGVFNETLTTQAKG